MLLNKTNCRLALSGQVEFVVIAMHNAFTLISQETRRNLIIVQPCFLTHTWFVCGFQQISHFDVCNSNDKSQTEGQCQSKMIFKIDVKVNAMVR